MTRPFMYGRELTNEERSEVMQRMRLIKRDLEWAPEESYHKGHDTEFQNSCGCYSEWTTEACSLSLFVKAALSERERPNFELRYELEQAANEWAQGALDWSGCECCGNALYVSVQLYNNAR